jgi:hypothetical protein
MAPKDWTQWLNLASLIHNNRKNKTTELSPNEILLGYEPETALSETIPTKNEDMEECIKIMMERRQQAIWAINRTAKQSKTVKDLYQEGNQVWLEASHIKTRHQKTKLVPKRYGPFRIRRKVSPVAYQLTLPTSWGIHNVFHTSLLHPYHKTKEKGPNFMQPPPELIKGEEEYEVEAIRNHRCQG